MPQISVIIPVFNGEAYLSDCIQSILRSTCKDLEVIIVDDGSTDGSARICEAFAGADPRVRLIRQENKGVSAARNMGLRHAAGEYVAFVDADDLLSEHILMQALNAGGQLVCWNAVGELPFVLDHMSCENLFAAVLSTGPAGFKPGRYFRACWGKLFLRSAITENQLAFDEKLYIGEDAVFLLQYLSCVRDVRFLDAYGYDYRIRPASAVRRYKKDLLRQSLLQRQHVEALIRARGYSENRTVRTAAAILYWDMFGKLIQNSRKAGKDDADALKWFPVMASYFRQRDLDSSMMPKLCKLQYKLFSLLPPKAHCRLMSIYFMLKRGEKSG